MALAAGARDETVVGQALARADLLSSRLVPGEVTALSTRPRATRKARRSTSWPSLFSARDLPLVAAPPASYEISAGRTSGRRSHGSEWPVTLGSHHTNQTSRKDGATVDATSVRGVSAMVDGSRWVSVVQVERITDEDKVESVVTLSMAKSNYSMIASPVVLRYGDGGVLVPMTADERAAADKVRDAADPKARRERKKEADKTTRQGEIDAAVIACVRAKAGIGATDLRIQVKAMATCGADAADTAIARAIQAGLVRRQGEGKTQGHYLVQADPSAKPQPSVTNGVNGTGMAVDHGYSLDDV